MSAPGMLAVATEHICKGDAVYYNPMTGRVSKARTDDVETKDERRPHIMGMPIDEYIAYAKKRDENGFDISNQEQGRSLEKKYTEGRAWLITFAIMAGCLLIMFLIDYLIKVKP